MGVFDPDYKRLELILVLFIFISVMYACEFVFLKSATYTYAIENVEGNYNQDLLVNESQFRNDTTLYDIIAFMTFTPPEVPIYMQVIMSPVSIIIDIIFAYLIIDIIYDWIKALPLT